MKDIHVLKQQRLCFVKDFAKKWKMTHFDSFWVGKKPSRWNQFLLMSTPKPCANQHFLMHFAQRQYFDSKENSTFPVLVKNLTHFNDSGVRFPSFCMPKGKHARNWRFPSSGAFSDPISGKRLEMLPRMQRICMFLEGIFSVFRNHVNSPL